MSEELPTSLAGCEPQRPSASPQKRRAPCQDERAHRMNTQAHRFWDTGEFSHGPPTQACTLDVATEALLDLSLCVLTHTGTVGYLRANSSYGFQIPLCKGILRVTPGYICTFLIQRKRSRRLWCIRWRPEGWLNACAVIVRKKNLFYFTGFFNISNVMCLQSRL